MTKRVLAAVLCALMALALLPASALAENGNAADLQAVIDGAYATGSLTLQGTYDGIGNAVSVYITSPLTLDLNGQVISNISLHIGNSNAAPAVTIKDSGSGGHINCDTIVKDAINVHSGSLTVESGSLTGDRDGGSGIEISGGSVTIRGGTIKGNRGIHFLGGNLTFDCAVGKTATVTGVGVNSLSLANDLHAPVTVANGTQVTVGSDVKTAADLVNDIADTITIGRTPVPPSITAPSSLTVRMSDTAAYSDPFTLAGNPLPSINNVSFVFEGARTHDYNTFSWDAANQRVKVVSNNRDAGVYTVTVEDTAKGVSCDWQVTIEPFIVPVNANKPKVATNRYVIDPGDSITFTADTTNMTTNRLINWVVSDLSNSTVANYFDQNSLTCTPTGSIRCLAYAANSPRRNIVLAEIEVYLRASVTQGANSRWLPGSADGLRFVTTGNEGEFFGISYDGAANMIPRSGSAGKYDVSPVTGGMALTLQPTFLAALPNGSHTLTFLYNGGLNTVSTVIYIGNSTPGGDADGDTAVPKTGDDTPLLPLCGLALLAGAGLTVSTAARRRKRAK